MPADPFMGKDLHSESETNPIYRQWTNENRSLQVIVVALIVVTRY